MMVNKMQFGTKHRDGLPGGVDVGSFDDVNPLPIANRSSMGTNLESS